MAALWPWATGPGGDGAGSLAPAVAAGVVVTFLAWATGRLLERSDASFHQRELRRVESLLGQELVVEHRWVTWSYDGLDEEGRALYRQVPRRQQFTGRLLAVEIERSDGPGSAGGEGGPYGQRLILRFETGEGERTVRVEGFGGVEAGEKSLAVLQSGDEPFLLLLRRVHPFSGTPAAGRG